MHSTHRFSLVNHNLHYEISAGANETSRRAYWATMAETEVGGAQLLDAASLSRALRSPMVVAKKLLPSQEPTALRRYDAWMDRKLAGELDAQQPLIAAPMLRIDPKLYGLSAPPLLDANHEESHAPPATNGSWARLGEHGEDSVEPAVGRDGVRDGASTTLAVVPPRRVHRRRRVAMLLFSDGSSCSCATDCMALSAAAAGSPSDRGCCAHVADGRAALCDGPVESESEHGRIGLQLDDGSTRSGASESGARDSGAAASQKGMPALESRASTTNGDSSSTTAAVAARSCPESSEGIFSRAHGQPVTLLFLNRAPYPVSLAHLDGDGAEVPVMSLRSAEHAELAALTSHAWRVRTLGGTLLKELVDTLAVPQEDGVAMVHIHPCNGVL